MNWNHLHAVYKVNRCKVTVWKHSICGSQTILSLPVGEKRKVWIMLRMVMHSGVLKSESIFATHAFIYQTWREMLLLSDSFMLSLFVVLTYHLNSMIRFALRLLIFC